MLLNYLKVAFRNYRKNKLYASLNTLGLAIGYAAFILIGIYVQFETSFENFHARADRTYRITYEFNNGNGYQVHWARLPFDYINQLPEAMPEVDKLIRFQNHERKYIRVGEEKFRPEHSYITDKEVFEVFDFELIKGNPETALAEPHSLVLTETLAKKYFGNENPMGKQVFIIGEYTTDETAFKVTGVMKDQPSNSHMPVNLFMSFENEQQRTWWAYIYILLKEGTRIESVEAKIADFVAKHDENGAQRITVFFQPLKDIHLHSNLAREIVPNGNALYVKIFIFVGLFILAIAMINYLNLSSALSIARSKEVGMRMILGAEKKQLVRFALLESILYHFMAALLGLIIAKASFPYFEELMETTIPIPWVTILSGLGITILIGGLISGIYPAFALTSMSSLKMINHNKSFSLGRNSGSSFNLKRALVGIQFCVSILLVSSAWIAYNQVTYLHQKNLGMDKDQVIAIPGIPNPVTDKYTTFRDQVQSVPGVKSVSACMEVPSREIRDVGPALVQGRNQDPAKAPMLDMQVISPGFLETMGLELVAGEDRTDQYIFTGPPAFGEDLTPEQYFKQQPRTYMINETAMRKLGFEKPEEAVGQLMSWSISTYELAVGPITGVVKDFHQETLKNKVDPTVMIVEQIWLRTFLLKVGTENIEKTVAGIQKVWDDMYPSYPMEYHFLDDLYNQLYKSERSQLKLMISFSLLAIFIAILGLFSLIAYSLQTRTREIAIRRILGASLHDLMQLIGKEYLIVLILGGIVAIPVSYFWVKDWLANFAYRVEISPLVYLLSVGLVIALLLGTVGFQTLRSANGNPAHDLRDE
jgi:putative ABC transport system permease protein